MNRARWVLILFLFTLLPGPQPARATDPALGWSLVASMARARTDHSATLLGDGRLLVAGGDDRQAGDSADRAEIYDPRADRWTEAGRLNVPRRGQYAARLADGRVLVAGGLISVQAAPFAEAFDPNTNTWRPLGPLIDAPSVSVGRQDIAGLPDGRLLVLDELDFDPQSRVLLFAITARIFDPATGTFTAAAKPQIARRMPTATTLRDGRVLVSGGEAVGTNGVPGYTAASEIYDPATNRWSDVAPMQLPRRGHSAVALTDGRVLIAGGWQPFGGASPFTASAELYDPATDRWATTGSLPGDVLTPVLTLLSDGRVMATGGVKVGDGASDTVRRDATIYNPQDGRWSGTTPMLAPRAGHTATALPDGQVLVVGGETSGLDRSSMQSAERYGPGVSSGTCFFQTGRCIDGNFLAQWQAHGGLAVNGYPLTNERDERLEDGKFYRVQYFERVRIEYHPENSAPYDLLYGQFGRRIHPADPPVAAATGARYFTETGHNVAGRFRDYWEEHGDLYQFGYPLTEVISERLDDGRTYQVQYFERARFEYHPENQPPYDVLLGQFGRRILNEVDAGR